MQNFNKKFIFILFIGLGLVFSFFKIGFWKQNIAGGDSLGYYLYLPAFFIHHDAGSFDKSIKAAVLHHPDVKIDMTGGGEEIVKKCDKTNLLLCKYTSGVATMLAPAFFITHLCAKVTGQIADGYTNFYGIGLGLGVIAWLVIGMYYLLVVLLRYFDRSVAATVVLSLVFATNIYYNVTYNGIMSHALLCSVYALLVYHSDTYYRNPTIRRALYIGLCCGMISLMRMNELYCIIVPLLWNIKSFSGIKDRFLYIKTNFIDYLYAGLLMVSVFIPQIIYWKTYSGSWFFNGYRGESFDFRHSHWLEGWFGFDNGWLVWTPIMVLALVGLLLSAFKERAAFAATVVLLPLHAYIIYSWWCWNYINGFGSRPMEHLYPLLAFGMANLYTIAYKNYLGKALIGIVLVAASALNIFQNFQMINGLLLTTTANPAYYWAVFGKTKPSRDILIARASGETQPVNPKRIKEIRSKNFEDTTKYKGASTAFHQSGRYSQKFEGQSLMLDTLAASTFADADYLRIEAQFYCEKVLYSYQNWETPNFYIAWLDKNYYKINEKDSGIWPFQLMDNPDFSIYSAGGRGNEWADGYFYVRVPKNAHAVSIGIWNGAKIPFYIDDVKYSTYKR